MSYTPAPDLVEAAARAMQEYDGEHLWELLHPAMQDEFRLMADAVVTRIEPLIRASERERLAMLAESGHPDCLTPCSLDPDDDWQVPLAGWIRRRVQT